MSCSIQACCIESWGYRNTMPQVTYSALFVSPAPLLNALALRETLMRGKGSSSQALQMPKTLPTYGKAEALKQWRNMKAKSIVLI